MLAPKREELAPRLRSIGDEARIALVRVRLLLPRDRIRRRTLALHRHVDAVNLRGVEPEYLGLQLFRQLRIAVLLLQLVRNLERAERLNLILRRAVPDAIRPPH